MAPAIDGNVERVIARHAGIHDEVGTSVARRRIREVVEQRLDPRSPGDFNQALMELGALVCTPTSPSCGRCPVAVDCTARKAGIVDRLPVRKKPRAAVAVTARVILAVDGRHALATRIAAGEPNAGQVELPGAGMLASVGDGDLAATLRSRFGARVDVGGVVATVRHTITHHRIVLRAHAATVRHRGRLEWLSLSGDTPWTTPSRKVFGIVFGKVFDAAVADGS